MFNWIRQSFYRQVMAMLIIFGLFTSVTFGIFDFVRERSQLQTILQADAMQLGDTLSLVIADDVFYRKHFELWNRINAIYKRHLEKDKTGLLYYIREISVTDNEGLVLGHSSPRDHPLLKPDKHFSFDPADNHDGEGQVLWKEQPQSALQIRYPIYFSNEKVGDLCIDFNPQPMLALQRSLALTYLSYEVIFLLILFVLARILAHWLAQPLELASDVLPRLGSGDVELPTLRVRQDELKAFASAIEDADRRIQKARIAAQGRQEELEKHVRERTQEIEAFTYSVSHDLRSPLRAINGFSLALLEDYAEQLDAEGKNHLQRVRDAAIRMGEIIDDLLMLSHISRQGLSFTRTNLSQIANDIIAELREETPQRAVEVHIDANMEVQGDARLLRIALTNLLGNAWKYTGKTTHPRIDFTRGEYQGKPVFLIRDNGAGFDMQYADKLFGAFQRLHGRDEYEGTGIGLAIVQRIIRRHHGEIWATAEIERGATFYVHIEKPVAA